MKVVWRADVNGIDVVSFDQFSPIVFKGFKPPCFCKFSSLFFITRGYRLKDWLVFEVRKNGGDMGIRISVHSAHQTTSDESDSYDFFIAHSVLCLCLWLNQESYSLQPWAFLTSIILARILFQVSCLYMTSLGNIHPSQHIWRNRLVRLPFSSRSQNPAWCGISSRPLGSSARQCRPVLSCAPDPKTVPSF